MTPVSRNDYTLEPPREALFGTSFGVEVVVEARARTKWYQITLDVPTGITKVEIRIGSQTVCHLWEIATFIMGECYKMCGFKN